MGGCLGSGPGWPLTAPLAPLGFHRPQARHRPTTLSLRLGPFTPRKF